MPQKFVSASLEKEIKEAHSGTTCAKKGEEEKCAGLCLINESIWNVEIKIYIGKAEDCIWTLHKNNILALKMTVCKYIPQTEPHISIKHIMKILKPLSLQAQTQSINLWRKSESFDKIDLGALMR